MPRKPKTPKSLADVVRMLADCIQEIRSNQMTHRDAAAIAKLAQPLIQAIKLSMENEPQEQPAPLESLTDEQLEELAELSN